MFFLFLKKKYIFWIFCSFIDFLSLKSLPLVFSTRKTKLARFVKAKSYHPFHKKQQKKLTEKRFSESNFCLKTLGTSALTFFTCFLNFLVPFCCCPYFSTFLILDSFQIFRTGLGDLSLSGLFLMGGIWRNI